MRGCHVWNYFLTEHCIQMFWETGRGQHTMHHDRIWGDVKYETLLNRTCKFVFWETGRGRHALQLRKLNGVQFGNYFYMTHVPRLFGNRKGAAWGSMCCTSESVTGLNLEIPFCTIDVQDFLGNRRSWLQLRTKQKGSILPREPLAKF